MRLLVSSAEGANGRDTNPSSPSIPLATRWGRSVTTAASLTPRGLCVDPSGDLLFVNNGNDRVLALDQKGQVLKDTGPINALDPWRVADEQ